MSDFTPVEYEPVAIDENTDVKVPLEPTTDTPTVNVFNDQNLCEEDEQYLLEYNRLSVLYRQLLADVFIQNLLRDYKSDEDRLDATRHLFFSDFPFDINSELKRRAAKKRTYLC